MESPALRLLADLQARQRQAEAAVDNTHDEGDVDASPALRLLAQLKARMQMQQEPGEDGSGEDGSGEDGFDEEVAGEEVAGEEVAGEDGSGEDGFGEEVAGEEEAGEENARMHHLPLQLTRSFSCWSARGNWLLHGISWMDAGFGSWSMPIEERVIKSLEDNPWCWDIDFSAAPAPSPTWFHITPATVTHDVAYTLSHRVYNAMHTDFKGLRGTYRQRQTNSPYRRLPESEQTREPLVWVEHLVYLWNISRGHCQDPRCAVAQPLTFQAAVREQSDGSRDRSEIHLSFSMQRCHNEYMHQWWNISGLVHTFCNSVSNSHNTCGFDPARQVRAVAPNLAQVAKGGPSGHFEDFIAANPHIRLPNICVENGYNKNFRYMNSWLKQQGITHSAACNSSKHRGPRNEFGGCPHTDCPFGMARAQLIADLGGPHIIGDWRNHIGSRGRRRLVA